MPSDLSLKHGSNSTVVSRTIKALEGDSLGDLIQMIMNIDNRKTISYLQRGLKEAVISYCADRISHTEGNFWMLVAKDSSNYLADPVSIASAKYHLSK